MRARILVGGVIIAAAVVYLIVSGIKSSAQYYVTVKELREKGLARAGRGVRVSGFVVGDSIAYNPQTSRLSFDIVDSRDELTSATQANTLVIVYTGPKPDLLQNGKQVVVEGRLDPDGTFEASNLLFNCPSRYEDQLTALTPTPAR